MIRSAKSAALTPKCKFVQEKQTNSVKINRNKNSIKVKTQKRQESSTASNTNSKAIPKLRNCALKLKRFKMPPLATLPDHFDDVSKDNMQNTSDTLSTKKNCGIRLSRMGQCTEQESLEQTARNSPARSLNKENATSCVNGVIQTQASRKLKFYEEQNDLVNNHNPLLCVDDAIKSSTPLKPAAPLQREPFKVLNLQEVLRESNSVNDIQQSLKTQPIITKENRESLRKLSLSRSKFSQKSRNANKIVRFEPLRNSTLYAADIRNNTTHVTGGCADSLLTSNQLDDIALESEQQPEKADVDKSAEKSPEKPQNSLKNFANKSDLIEQLLLSDNDENQSYKVDQQPRHIETTTLNKTNKFFHTSRNVDKTVVNEIQPVNKTRLSRKRRVTQRGKHSVGSVYEFLSQSQTSDSDSANKKIDPAADVIKKLIAEGKVRVATHKKGTGKLTIKSKNIPKKRGVFKRKKVAKKNIKKIAKNIDEDPHIDADDEQHDALQQPEIPDEPVQPVEEAPIIPVSKKNHDNSAGGDTFSDLARSVLMSETKKKENSRKKITYQRKLLEAAQKFVSTPVRKVSPPLDKSGYMSPIMPQGASRAAEGGASPWRVDDDAHLPSVFYFSRNSTNLPSFSSDYIPSSPKKQKHRYQDLLPEPELHEPGATLNSDDYAPLPIIPTVGVALSKSSSSHSSFSSNDSNAENNPPPSSATNPNTPGGNNLNLNDQRQQLNPRRELSHRSPLQIIDVISLPPWNSSKKQYTIQKKDQKSTNNNNDTTLANQATKDNVSDLFGFEEFLADDSAEADQHTPIEINKSSNNTSFRNKLHGLKHLRPAQKEKPQSSSNCIANVFDINSGKSGGKQLQIKEMLCSTMINHGKDKEVLPTKRMIKINEARAGAKKLTNEPTELFIDPDPGASFNEKDSLRTYVRPYKRKRKLRHNFVMFLDSDESGDDDVAHQKDNFETSKEFEAEHKKKKHKKEQKDNVELNSFMHEFNDMCKEVNNYELIIE